MRSARTQTIPYVSTERRYPSPRRTVGVPSSSWLSCCGRFIVQSSLHNGRCGNIRGSSPPKLSARVRTMAMTITPCICSSFHVIGVRSPTPPSRRVMMTSRCRSQRLVVAAINWRTSVVGRIQYGKCGARRR